MVSGTEVVGFGEGLERKNLFLANAVGVAPAAQYKIIDVRATNRGK